MQKYYQPLCRVLESIRNQVIPEKKLVIKTFMTFLNSWTTGSKINEATRLKK